MRTCLTCGKQMAEGFLLEEVCETFCSDECLDVKYPGASVEMAAMTDDELEDSTWYWTTWEADDTEDDDELPEVTLDVALDAFDNGQKVYVLYIGEALSKDEILWYYTKGRPLGVEAAAKDEDLEDFTFYPDFDEDRFKVTTYEYAKECFEKDQAVYRLLDNGEVFLNRHMDEIIFHEGCDGVFLVERIYCPRCRTNELDMDDLEANALCRHDNETMLCSPCGQEQAIQAMKEELGWT